MVKKGDRVEFEAFVVGVSPLTGAPATSAEATDFRLEWWFTRKPTKRGTVTIGARAVRVENGEELWRQSESIAKVARVVQTIHNLFRPGIPVVFVEAPPATARATRRRRKS